MHLRALLESCEIKPKQSVPDSMLGLFRRRSISFANGKTDTRTQVFWLQGRNLTIDLRLPEKIDANAHKESLEKLNSEHLRHRANYEGWIAQSHWDGKALSWHQPCSYQWHNRWPEPALLHRVGNCMIEFAPSGVYVEDWRLQAHNPGPLISLRLIEETNETTGECTHKDGGLIICGNFAGLVLGRPDDSCGGRLDKFNASLRDAVQASSGDRKALAALFGCETSLAEGSLSDGYSVSHSTDLNRVGESLCSLDGFDFVEQDGELRQRFETQDGSFTRRFIIDGLESSYSFDDATSTNDDASRWFAQEEETLARYLEKCR